MKTNQITFISSLIMSFFIFSCGSNKEVLNNNSTSQSIQSSDLSSQHLAKCSIDMSNHPELGIKVQIYEDSEAGMRFDLVRVKFIRIPLNFSSSEDNSLQLWTRTINSNNQWGQWQNIRFFFQYKNNFKVLRTPYSYQDVTWATLKQIAQYFRINVTTVDQFFSQIELIAILDQEGHGKIITPAIYLNQSQNPIHVTALAPLFIANPNTYAQTKPQNLVNLHPLKSLMGTQFSDSQYVFESNQFCF